MKTHMRKPQGLHFFTSTHAGSSHLQLGLVEHPMQGRGIFGTYADAIVAGCHVVEGGQTSTGSVLAWFKRTLCGPGVSYADLDREAAQIPAGCEGLVALDHFQVGMWVGSGQ